MGQAMFHGYCCFGCETSTPDSWVRHGRWCCGRADAPARDPGPHPTILAEQLAIHAEKLREFEGCPALATANGLRKLLTFIKCKAKEHLLVIKVIAFLAATAAIVKIFKGKHRLNIK